MIIETTLGELEEVLYKYGDLLGWAGGVEVQESKETRLGIAEYRIQIPSLDISLRSGDLMSQHGGEYYEYHNPQTGEHVVVDNPPPEDAEWEVDASITVVCELNEKDPHKYLGWSTDGFQETAYDYLRPKFDSCSALDDVPCFIDTADFMESEEEAQKYAKECEENYDGDETQQ